MNINIITVALIFIIAINLQADDVVIQWNQAALTAIANTRSPPTVAARALAIAHTGIYDAWAAYDAIAYGTRYGNLLRRPPNEFTDANKSEAISFAAYRLLSFLFPSQIVGVFNPLMDGSLRL